MSGSFLLLKDSPIAEWNVYCDPKAAQIVYGTSVSSHTSIGLDVTLKLDMNFAEVNTRFNHDLLKPIIDMFDILGLMSMMSSMYPLCMGIMD